MKTITCKIGNMRKEQKWVVYPASFRDSRFLMCQCETRVLQLDPGTGKGILSKNCPSGAYFVHLTGGDPVTVPSELVARFQDARPGSGTQIGGGVWVA